MGGRREHLSREMSEMRAGVMGKSGSGRRGISARDRRACKGPEACSKKDQSV